MLKKIAVAIAGSMIVLSVFARGSELDREID
jgi:hypothetical protein